MTEYVEIEERDGAARLGTLRLAEEVRTPAMVTTTSDSVTFEGIRWAPNPILRDAGSEWVSDRELPEGDDSLLTILPHRGLPGGTPDRVQEAFAGDVPDVDYPSAAVITPDTAANQGADAYVLSNA
ncbi:MAG: tRNA-ribosyltransferase, partial [Salinirussus sp.]